ncbi:unnamed protein product, partial [Adineta steineri]
VISSFSTYDNEQECYHRVQSTECNHTIFLIIDSS